MKNVVVLQEYEKVLILPKAGCMQDQILFVTHWLLVFGLITDSLPIS